MTQKQNSEEWVEELIEENIKHLEHGYEASCCGWGGIKIKSRHMEDVLREFSNHLQQRTREDLVQKLLKNAETGIWGDEFTDGFDWALHVIQDETDNLSTK